MQKKMNKKKLSLAAIRAAILSFPFKVMGQFREDMYQDLYGVPQTKYGIPAPSIDIQELYGVPSYATPLWGVAIKIAQRALVGVTFIIGIINLIKIRKIDDKVQKKKKIKKTIIILVILAVVLVAAFLIPALLLKK